MASYDILCHFIDMIVFLAQHYIVSLDVCNGRNYRAGCTPEEVSEQNTWHFQQPEKSNLAFFSCAVVKYHNTRLQGWKNYDFF